MSEEDPRPTPNRLGQETSAYLRQHMHNPVDWYPWGEAALTAAREQDKPLLVSIGYSACHWCHVMEHESFENPEIAAEMNRLFINIKVDREERPDVDQIYMDTVVGMTGQGGWPLTVFCTPDGRPFYGGTYYPPERREQMPGFPEIMHAVEDAYRNRRSEMEQSAEEVVTSLGRRPTGAAEQAPGLHSVVAAARALMDQADRVHGGFGQAPKFPTPTSLELLLVALDTMESEEREATLAHLVHSCREMARQGLYDHLGGGFHRYCVDSGWVIPHFEKMLYDQGLLLRVYTETWRRTGASDEDLLWPIRETAEYLRREMTDPAGGYLASQDADSEGEEGKFYVWRPEEIDALLGDTAEDFRLAYGVTEQGNFEHTTTHLLDRARRERAAFADERARLLSVRAERIAPATDKKRVASWNAYAISGLARAGSLLRDERMLEEAAAAADFILREMMDKRGHLLRVYNEGRARIPAFLDDHGALLDACLDLYRAGAGERFLAAALHAAEQISERFFDPEEDDLFLTPLDGEPLAFRPRSDHDGATPHAAGLAVLGLVRMGPLSGRSEFTAIAERVIRSHTFVLEQQPHAFPTLLRAIATHERGAVVTVIAGDPDAPDTQALAHRARTLWAPEDAVVVLSPGATLPAGLDPFWAKERSARDGRATAYVCRGQTCSLPVFEPAELVALGVS
jgi:uncharacterized protein YyaL (SSP411 family)